VKKIVQLFWPIPYILAPDHG